MTTLTAPQVEWRYPLSSRFADGSLGPTTTAPATSPVTGDADEHGYSLTGDPEPERKP